MRRWRWRRPEPDREGLAEAREMLAKARADEPRVAAIAEAHKQKIRDNHFGPKIAAALQEGRR